MNPKLTHPWNLTPEEAQQLQQQLVSQVITQDQPGRVDEMPSPELNWDTGLTRHFAHHPINGV